MSTFTDLMQAQIRNEFSASQQYIANAVWLDGEDLPQLASFFYRQSVEERNHAMMLVQYLLDRGITPVIPGVDEARNDFSSVLEPIELALVQEKQVTEQIEALFAAARSEIDALGEQFMLWFLKEQVEEVATMSTLVTIAKRAGDNLFHLEEYIAREDSPEADDPSAPAAAGGAI